MPPKATRAAKAVKEKLPTKARKARKQREAQPTFPIAYVKYHDHCWLEAKELEKINAATPYIIEESGFLLMEKDEYITLAKERSTDGEKGKTQYDDATIIMRSDILDLRIFNLEPEEPARTSTVRRRRR